MDKDKLIWFDPGLSNNEGKASKNLGDLIISESVQRTLLKIFKSHEVIRISTHTHIPKKFKQLLKLDIPKIVGGSNLLSSRINGYNQWKSVKYKFQYYLPFLSNVTLLGVGWWQYQNNPDWTTRRFYNKILGENTIHSVRDEYTKLMLNKCGLKNIENTTCPTIWELDDNYEQSRGANDTCVFTLTDYNRDEIRDNELLKLLLEIYKDIYFFPQGTEDESYLKTLNQYEKNSKRFRIIFRSINAYNELLSSIKLDYIGTRLHGGIKALQNNQNTLIISIDNRAAEIKKDINLPIIARDSLSQVVSWYENKLKFGRLNIPTEPIKKWMSQFK